MKTLKKSAILLTSILMLFVLFSCETEGDLPKYDPPGNHTISKDGRMHKDGLHDPLANCISCHGNDLMGGSVGVSCFECHNQEW